MGYVLLKEGEQKKLLEKAIDKFGSEKKLSIYSGIPYQTINYYKNNKYNIPEERLYILLKLLDIDYNSFENNVISHLNKNWGRKKGGDALIQIIKQNGKYYKYVNYLKERGSKIFKNWHKTLREKNEKEYFRI